MAPLAELQSPLITPLTRGQISGASPSAPQRGHCSISFSPQLISPGCVTHTGLAHSAPGMQGKVVFRDTCFSSSFLLILPHLPKEGTFALALTLTRETDKVNWDNG
jgi:hypothetical protein